MLADVDFNPVLRSQPLGLFDGLGSQLRAGRALVLVGNPGLKTVTPGSPLGFWEKAGYTTIYEIDLAEHEVRYSEPINSRVPGFNFEATVEAIAYVEDPEVFLREYGDKGLLRLLKSHVAPELARDAQERAPNEIAELQRQYATLERDIEKNPPVVSGVRFRRLRISLDHGEATRRRHKQARLHIDYTVGGEVALLFEAATDPTESGRLKQLVADLRESSDRNRSEVDAKLEYVTKQLALMKDHDVDKREIQDRLLTLLDDEHLAKSLGKDSSSGVPLKLPRIEE